MTGLAIGVFLAFVGLEMLISRGEVGYDYDAFK